MLSEGGTTVHHIMIVSQAALSGDSHSWDRTSNWVGLQGSSIAVQAALSRSRRTPVHKSLEQLFGEASN